MDKSFRFMSKQDVDKKTSKSEGQSDEVKITQGTLEDQISKAVENPAQKQYDIYLDSLSQYEKALKNEPLLENQRVKKESELTSSRRIFDAKNKQLQDSEQTLKDLTLQAQQNARDDWEKQCQNTELRISNEKRQITAAAEKEKMGYQQQYMQKKDNLDRRKKVNREAIAKCDNDEVMLNRQIESFENNSFDRSVGDSAICAKVQALYDNNLMTEYQREFMSQDVAAFCRSKNIETLSDVQKIELNFAQTDICRQLRVIPITNNEIISLSMPAILITLLPGILLIIISGMLLKNSTGSGGGVIFLKAVPGILGFLLLVVAVVLIRNLADSSHDLIRKLTEYWVESETEYDDEAETAFYCFIHHNELADYLNENTRRSGIERAQAGINSVKARRESHMKDQELLRQDEENLARDEEALKNKLQEIDENRDRDLQNAETLRDGLTEPDFKKDFRSEDDEKIWSQNNRIINQKSERDEAGRQFDIAAENLELASDAVRKNAEIIKDCNDNFRRWKGTPPLKDDDPAFHKEIIVENGKSDDVRAFIMRHDLEWVNIRYSSDDPEENMCTVLKDIIWQLTDGYGKMNARELLQIHIIDERSRGQALQIDGRFLSKICTAEHEEDYGPGIYVYGKDVRLLNKYLNDQWNSIVQYLGDNAVRLNNLDGAPFEQSYPQDYAIYGANRLLRQSTGGISRLEPFAYKVLFILVPGQENERAGTGEIKELLDMINQDPFCKSGILPVFFTNVNDINDNYKKYIDKCSKIFDVRLSDNVMEEVS